MIKSGYLAVDPGAHGPHGVVVEIEGGIKEDVVNARVVGQSDSGFDILHINTGGRDFMASAAGFIGNARADVVAKFPELGGYSEKEFDDPDTGEMTSVMIPRLATHKWV